MRESFLHLIWEQKLFSDTNLQTVQHDSLQIIRYGHLNRLHGPDVNNGLITLNGQKWAGNIEIHIKSSDWYAHQHQADIRYGKVILHVVYEYDLDVFDLHGNVIPTLELKKYVFPNVLKSYEDLMGNKFQWIACENTFAQIDSFKIKKWLESLYIERLERKVVEISELFEKTKNDWEHTLFLLMAKYFGGNLNGDFWMSSFLNVPFSTIKKAFVNQQVDSLFFGLLGLLEENIEDSYHRELRKKFLFQKKKYNLQVLGSKQLNFYGCRPMNFPTIRLAQFIALYQQKLDLFESIISKDIKEFELVRLLSVSVDSYWQNHYNFTKESPKTSKKISRSFMDLLLLNVILPFKFFYSQKHGLDLSYFVDFVYPLKPESNSIVKSFEMIGFKASSALETQALITLKKQYCNVQNCVKCQLGTALLQGIK